MKTNTSAKATQIDLIGAAMTLVLLVGCSADDGGVVTVPGAPVPVPTPADPAPTIGTLTAMPATVVSGGMTTINYTATGAVSCMRTGQWASPDAGPTSGTVPVTVPTAAGVYTYGLTCTNATGQQTSSFVNVTVLAPADGGGGDDDVTGGDDGGTVDNGDTPTDVTDGPDGPAFPDNFLCTRSARFYGNNPSTMVTVNGLVGDAALGGLLGQLGAGSLTQLLASVSGKELAVDRSLDTFAQFNLTAGLLGLPLPIPGGANLVSSVGLVVGLNSQVPAGEFAVFGLSFPQATLEASLGQTVTIQTFLGTTLVETRDVTFNIVDLLGASALGDAAVFAGFENQLPYDSAAISLNPALISANVGNAMNVHELCTGGRFVMSAP